MLDHIIIKLCTTFASVAMRAINKAHKWKRAAMRRKAGKNDTK